MDGELINLDQSKPFVRVNQKFLVAILIEVGFDPVLMQHLLSNLSEWLPIRIQHCVFSLSRVFPLVSPYVMALEPLQQKFVALRGILHEQGHVRAVSAYVNAVTVNMSNTKLVDLVSTLVIDKNKLVGLFEKTFGLEPMDNFREFLAWQCCKSTLPV